jgi:hypothetical protein
MNSASGLGAGLDPAARFPDFTLSDHAGNERRAVGPRGRRPHGAPVLSRLVVPEGAGVLSPHSAGSGRGRGRVLAPDLGQRRCAARQCGLAGGARRAIDVPLRRGPQRPAGAGAEGDDRNAQRPLRQCEPPGRGTASRGKDHERRRYRVKRVGLQRAGRARHRLFRGTAARPRRGAARGPPLHLRGLPQLRRPDAGDNRRARPPPEEPLAPEVREELLEAFHGRRGK